MDAPFSLVEIADVILALSPVNLSSAAANGRWVSMVNCEGMNVLLIDGIGATDEDVTLNLQQAKDASGTGAKTLQLRRVDYKIGATAIAAAQDKWNRVATIDRDNPANSWATSGIDAAENDLLVNIFVLPQDLDINNGFKYVRLQITDPGTTSQLGAALYIPAMRSYQGKKNVSLLA